MNTARPGGADGFGRRQVVAFDLLVLSLLVVVAMNWLPAPFQGFLTAPRPGYWIVLFGGFAITMTGAALSLRATVRQRRDRRQVSP